ncbi:HeH/LEM domain-containing protein [Streptococcus thoraltensis]
MKIYEHKKTGEKVITESSLLGDWILVDNDQALNSDEPDTIPELKSALTELGIEFGDKAKKAELLALYNANKGD